MRNQGKVPGTPTQMSCDCTLEVGISMKKFWYLIIFAFVFALLLGIDSKAQQTIFNVPSTDVLDQGRVYAELDVSFKVNNQDALRRFSSFVPRLYRCGGRRRKDLSHAAGCSSAS